jgi:hypothetical protein
MKNVRPKPIADETKKPAENLTAEEGFVLARIDGKLSVNDLVALTGLDSDYVEDIVTKLASKGAVALEAAESSGYLPEMGSTPDLGNDGEATLADFAAALGMDPSAFAASGGSAAYEAPVKKERVESRSDNPPAVIPVEMQLIEVGPASTPEVSDQPAELIPVDDDGTPIEAPLLDEVDAAVAATDNEIEATAVQERNWRQLYETKFRHLTTDQRIDHARRASGPDLLALCFDAEAKVVAGLLENHHLGLDHVRLIAFHHRTGVGLEMLSRRQDWIKDLLVERRLLRNPQLGEQVLGRIMASKRVFPTYKICIDRDIPDLTRVKSRGHLRQKWGKATSEERSDLLIRTEGRCLILMTGCTFDSKTTAILCGRPINSMIFIQTLAKFPATPPALLAHLYKQPFVRKNPPIRKLLLQHPNMPGDVKRNI